MRRAIAITLARRPPSAAAPLRRAATSLPSVHLNSLVRRTPPAHLPRLSAATMLSPAAGPTASGEARAGGGGLLALLGGASLAAAALQTDPAEAMGFCDDAGGVCHAWPHHFHPLPVWQTLIAFAVRGPSGAPWDALCQYCGAGNVDCTGTSAHAQLTGAYCTTYIPGGGGGGGGKDPKPKPKPKPLPNATSSRGAPPACTSAALVRKEVWRACAHRQGDRWRT